jgi:hypothetical protein
MDVMLVHCVLKNLQLATRPLMICPRLFKKHETFFVSGVVLFTQQKI